MSAAKFVEYNSVPYIFLSFEFSTTAPQLAHISLLKAMKRYEKAENCILSLYPIISSRVPLTLFTAICLIYHSIKVEVQH